MHAQSFAQNAQIIAVHRNYPNILSKLTQAGIGKEIRLGKC